MLHTVYRTALASTHTRQFPFIHSSCIYIFDSIQLRCMLLFCHFPSSRKFMAKVKDLYVLGQWVYFCFHFFFLHSILRLLFIVVFAVFENLLLFYYHFDKAAIFWCVIGVGYLYFFSSSFLSLLCCAVRIHACVCCLHQSSLFREVLHLSPITCLKVPDDKRKQKQNVHQIWWIRRQFIRFWINK